MTSICPGGGASEAKPGFAATVFVGPQVISALLNNIPTPWAVGLAALITGAAYELSSYCTTDPPADPVLTAADAIALLTPFHPGASNANLRFQQFIGRYLWWDMCQCTGGGTPAPPAAPARPTGWPDVEPPSLTSSIPCQTYIQTERFNVDNGIEQHTGVQPFIGMDVTSVEFRMSTQLVTAPGPDCRWQIEWYHHEPGSSLTSLRSDYFFPGVNDELVELIVPPPTATAHQTRILGYSGSGRVSAKVDIRFYCGGQVPGPSTACCPPDPNLAVQVSKLLELVTLMQRQLAPFAYVASTVHAGLTGDGEFAIQGLLGAKVSLTTIPGSRGVIDGQPDELFDIGYVTFAVEDGYPHSVRIEHNPQVILPARASVFTKLAYSLTPGVVATVTELVREP